MSRNAWGRKQFGTSSTLGSPLSKRLSALHLRDVHESNVNEKRSMKKSFLYKRSPPSKNIILRQDLSKINWDLENPMEEEDSLRVKNTSLSVPMLDLKASSSVIDERQNVARARSCDVIPTFEIDDAKSSSDGNQLVPPDAPRFRRRSPIRKTAEQIKLLRVTIPRPFKIYNDKRNAADHRRRRRALKHTLSPLSLTPGPPGRCYRRSIPNRKRPLHLWKTKHVARWANRIDPESVRTILEKKIDGERLLRVENEKDLLNLGFSPTSKLAHVLKNIQKLQAEDIIWHVNTLKYDSKLVSHR